MMHTPAISTPAALLPARSKAQVLDWSLVLVSQGIESLPAWREDAGAWVLEVAENDVPRATAAITAYERENSSAWRREVKWTGLLFDARAGLWFLALAVFHSFAWLSHLNFKDAGKMSHSAVQHGEWWRLITGMTLHADAGHLMGNIASGVVFLGLAMGCFGPGMALILSLLGGALGFLATGYLEGPSYSSIGASGFVMASLGLLAAHSVMLSRHEKRVVWMGRGLMAGFLLLVMLGFSPQSDVLAHIFGFIAGLTLGVIVLRSHLPLRKPSLNAVAAVISVGLVGLSWWRALR